MRETTEIRPSAKPRTRLTVDIVDDQPLTRVGLAVALNHTGEFEAGQVRGMPDALPASDRPVIVGVSRGDVREVEVVRGLAEGGRPVLVLLPEEATQAWAALRSHVAGGLSRLAPVSRVMRALRAVAAGERYWWLDPVRPGHEVVTVAGVLSERERELLGLLAVGCSDREIADQLVISVRTVWSHLERIRAKTGVRGRVELAMLAWQHPTDATGAAGSGAATGGAAGAVIGAASGAATGAAGGAAAGAASADDPATGGGAGGADAGAGAEDGAGARAGAVAHAATAGGAGATGGGASAVSAGASVRTTAGPARSGVA